jgi:Protein of unknown function (DUF1552)
VKDLNGQLGVSDRQKLDQYSTAVRALEQQLTAVAPAAQCLAQRDPGTDTDFVKRLNLLMDVMAFAVQCDLTRVITFMIGNAGGPGSMPYIGINDNYHNLVHAQGSSAATKNEVAKAVTWFVTQAATFAKRLKGIQEGANTALYNTSFMMSSEVGEGSTHTHHDMPIILAGNAGGAFKTGQHIAYAPEDPKARTLALKRDPTLVQQALAIPNTNRVANLYTSMLTAAGVEPSSPVPDSNGPLARL